MSVEDVLTMGQRIRVEALDAAIRADLVTAEPESILKVAKVFEDFIARETRLNEKPPDSHLEDEKP